MTPVASQSTEIQFLLRVFVSELLDQDQVPVFVPSQIFPPITVATSFVPLALLAIELQFKLDGTVFSLHTAP